MNERIKALAEQANADELSYAYYRGEKRPENAVTLHSVDLEKFAELIVRECMTICKEHPSRIVSNNWVADAVAPDIVSQFEEHFGVEE